MQVFSVRSPLILAPRFPSSSSRSRWDSFERSAFSDKYLQLFRSSKKYPDAKNHGFPEFKIRALGPTKAATGSNVRAEDTAKKEMQSQRKDLAFVAGATGKVGSRTVRELLKLGFSVRACVRSAQRAEALLESVRQMKVDGVAGTSGTRPVEKLEIIECDLEKDEIGAAIGNASIVICCIGASEKEIFDVTGPYRIDYKAAENLINAATRAKVNHFILLTSLGTNKIGFPAAILNLFWGVLIWKRKAEEALIASGLPYTIVRPGGMERPTDAYKETHNILLANEDTLFGGQVSNLQVAELMAFMAKNRKLSFCKVVEVVAETTAPLIPMEELLAKIPSKRELPAEDELEPVRLDTDSSEPISSVKTISEAVPKPRPLSPYATYEDLKPPTSPTPTPSTTPAVVVTSEEKQIDSVQVKSEEVASKELAQAPSQRPQPLSPYTTYEDLKPPTSPSPTPSRTIPSLKTIPADAVGSTESNTGNGAAATSAVVVNQSVGDQDHTQAKPKPLSPFTMYEDLKPPSSPIPSLPKY